MKTTKLFELKKIQTEFPNQKMRSSIECFQFISQFYGDDLEVYESFFLLLLNRQNTTIGYAKISQGGVAGTVVDTKIVAKYCIDSLCSSVILAHNHPSGNLTPSKADIDITNNIKKGLLLFDITVFDHIILAPNNKFFSFADAGFM